MLGSDTPELKKNADGSFTDLHPERQPRQGQGGELASRTAVRSILSHSPAYRADHRKAIGILSDPKSWPVPAVVAVK